MRRGRLERVEHVDNARQSGMHVASVLLRDNPEPYDYLCAPQPYASQRRSSM